MRRFLFITVVACLFAATISAQTETALPAGAEALEAKLMARVGPQTRSWIKQEAARQGTAGVASELIARKAITTAPSFQGLPNGDIDALVFLVMMEASKSAREDLKAIMNGLKEINEAKASLPAKTAPVPGQTVNVKTKPVQPKPVPRAQFSKQLQSARNDRDALSEMGEMESLRLQLSMDRLSKADQATSKAMKKYSDTAQSISQNLK